MSKDTILIFEDEKEHYQDLEKELTKNGLYEVIPHKDLLEAFSSGTSLDYIKDMIKKHWNKGLKLIICDLLVKNQNLGKTLINKIRSDIDFRVYDCKSFSALIPIIIWTSTADQNDINDAIKAGANDFAYKPSYGAKDPRTTKENRGKIDSLKNIIAHHINLFDKKLQLVEDNIPSHIKNDVIHFKEKNKDKTTAFIMTSFADEHKEVGIKITEILGKNNISCFMADAVGGQNTDDLLPNIEVFIHGCDFGIGIYADDSILANNEKIRINSNLSFEVGYMLSLNKKVCILKEKGLPKLNSDLCSKIYVEFDLSNTDEIEKELNEWISNKNLL